MSEWKTFQASPVQVNLKPWNPVYALGHPARRSSGGHWTCPEDLCRSTYAGRYTMWTLELTLPAIREGHNVVPTFSDNATGYQEIKY